MHALQILIAVMAIALGAFLLLRPRKAIDVQIAFYRRINWKMEPVSMTKEITNTRIMGASVLIFGVISIVYFIAFF